MTSAMGVCGGGMGKDERFLLYSELVRDTKSFCMSVVRHHNIINHQCWY